MSSARRLSALPSWWRPKTAPNRAAIRRGGTRLQPMTDGRRPMRLAYIDYHTCGEPVRIVTSGYPQLTGAGILDKRRQAREQHDDLRRAMMLEPRGHDGMYGVIPVQASHPEAAFGVLFTHNEGY